MILILILTTAVYSKNTSVSIEITPKEISVNPYEIGVYDITLTNFGKNGTYYINIEGIPKDWYSLSHDSIYMTKGEKKTIYLFVTPQLSEKDSYIGNISIDGIKESFRLNISQDHKIRVLMPTTVVSCICEEQEIGILVENNGKYPENLNLILFGDGLNVIDVDIQGFMLEPKASKIIPVKIKPMCNSEEKYYTLSVKVNSANSYASASTSTNIRKIKCFDFKVEYPREVRSCTGIKRSFNISIHNTGIREDSFEIDIGELGYSDMVKLRPGEIQDFEVTFSKDEEGVYEIPFIIQTKSDKREGLVRFVTEKCYGVDIDLDEDEITIKSGTGKLTKPVVKNIGTRTSAFDIKSSVIWVAIRPERIVLEPNQSENIFVYYSPEYGSSGEYNVRLFVESENSSDYADVKVKVVSEVEAEETPYIPINMTTTTEEIPTPPEINITKPTGFFSKIWEKFESFSSNISKKLDEMGANKVLISVIVGVVIALLILGGIYFIVMRG
ncbi:MAG: hypothetical protein QXY45_02795 [Candidatus Aenigmatarchaeota archaeon]